MVKLHQVRHHSHIAHMYNAPFEVNNPSTSSNQIEKTVVYGISNKLDQNIELELQDMSTAAEPLLDSRLSNGSNECVQSNISTVDRSTANQHLRLQEIKKQAGADNRVQPRNINDFVISNSSGKFSLDLSKTVVSADLSTLIEQQQPDTSQTHIQQG